ncbi:MAG: gfo/Idh/MocA family oxidoreductase [Acidobacteria bacterium]|nr:MAG: gfo/Idh/MocA family oxidoreductase [Acidobacteriota bacterium]
MSRELTTRRSFLKGTCLAGAFPTIVSPFALGLNGSVPASDRIVMGMIGVGSMGGGHVRAFLTHADVHVAAICDVREEHRNRAKEAVDAKYGDKACKTYSDFRELLARRDIDAVLIAVPDHWHALIGIEAAQAGKDMYYEKPMARTVAESKAARSAILRHQVVFQFGTQQRSSYNYRFAAELVRNGRIGELKTIMIGSATSQFVPNQPEQPVPPGFDYEMWLGPAPWAPYTFERCTRNWTLIYDYSLGCVSGAWGIHDVDIAQWVLGTDNTGPGEVEGWGVFPKEGLYDTATAWEVEHSYPGGVKLIHMDMRTALKKAKQFSLHWMGMLFEGTEGWIYVSRDGVHTEPASLSKVVIGPNEKQFPKSTDHRRNFLDCVRTRRQPISPIEAAVRSDTVCHQADIAMRLKRRLRWDPVAELFVGDEQANRMLSRAMRSPWHL